VVAGPAFADASLGDSSSESRVRDAGSDVPARLVRVRIIPRRSSPIERHIGRLRAERLSGRLTRAQLAALRHAPVGRAARSVFDQKQGERSQVLHELQPTASAAQRALRPAARAVRRLGGSIVEVDVLTMSLTALVSRGALPALREDRVIRAVVRAPALKPLGLDTSTATVGAPSFWQAGFLGGTGSTDRVPANLSILNDKADESHPAFAARPDLFERPDRTTTDGDLHGTGVASMAVSQGTSSCPTDYACQSDDVSPSYIGASYGVHKLLDARMPGGYDPAAWSLGIDQTNALSGLPLAGAHNRANVFSGSYGSHDPNVDDSDGLQGTDVLPSQYGTAYALSAGNDGPAQSLSSPCIAYDTICTAGVDPRFTSDPSDDKIADFSSRGPTPGGRKKPDLTAVAVSPVANSFWRSEHHIWRFETGTSYAAPQAAAAASLLAGSGITDPLAQKAILLDSARSGRVTPSAPMGTQTTWQPDWGWGELDLADALNERTNFYTDTVPGGGVRFYAAATQPGDRATLVWNRRVTSCLIAGCVTPKASALTNLDLELLDAATGGRGALSSSDKDNVEQVRAPAAGAVVYKVKASSGVDGAAAEPYAIAARRQVMPLANPQPTVVTSIATRMARRGRPVELTATIANPSPDLTAESAAAALRLPPGVTLSRGSAPAVQALGTLAKAGQPGSSRVVHWKVQGTVDGLKRLAVAASATRYGESFGSSATSDLRVDGTAPRVAVSARRPSGRSTAIRVAWRGRDTGVGVRAFDVQVTSDGRHYRRLRIRRAKLELRYRARHGGHVYRFRVRAADRLGNRSRYAYSRRVAVR